MCSYNYDSEPRRNGADGIYRSNLIAPQNPGVETVPKPSVYPWLQNVALRDLALHETHAACVDARGDIYQWGDGFFGPLSLERDGNQDRRPTATLRGKVRDHLYET